MTHPLPLPFSFSQAAQYARRPDANLCALISIHGPTEPSLADILPNPTFPICHLEFDDIEAPDPADPIASLQAHVRRRTLADLGRPQTPPALHHIQQLITFARQIQDLQGTLLLHCSGGISRSPTAALICLATWTNPGEEPACVHTIRHLQPAAQFHPDLLRFADHLLSRQGTLLQACFPP